jgi:hypothetical protein
LCSFVGRAHGGGCGDRSISRTTLVARHLKLGHSPQALIATLAHAVLREDAGFHAYQMLEVGVRQFTEWGDADVGRHVLIAVARYLAAHSPTERAALQTADIARRPDWRIKAAQAALPCVHAKPERSPATDPAATARQIEGGSDSDPLADAIEAWRRAANDCDRIEKSREGSKS